MLLQTPYNSYRHAAETQDPSAQILLLYDATINYIKQARVAVVNNDHDTRYQLVDKAMSIIRGLRACLEFGACEELAVAMDVYYESIDNMMILLQCNPSERLCDAIIKNLETIRNAWAEANANVIQPGNDNATTDSIV